MSDWTPQNGADNSSVEKESLPVQVDGATEDDGQAPGFPVVGIGVASSNAASLGVLLQALPADTGMAYVVVAQGALSAGDTYPESLRQRTELPVQVVANQTRLEPNHVYLTPPGVSLEIRKGVLEVSPQEGEGARAIDRFFCSLATDQGSRAIGVVLADVRSEGTFGLQAIRGEGGITIMQPSTFSHNSELSPNHSFSNYVDIVAAPVAIADRLADIGLQFRNSVVPLLQEGRVADSEQQQLMKILTLMRTVSGVDFRLCKPSSIRRRIARRMLLHRVGNLREYLRILQQNPLELRELQEDTLINVTQFFRDPEVFESFKTSVLPTLFEDRDPTQQIRIWVAGSSTGEEVYSYAMCLLEFLTGTASDPGIQIFGTDASEANIQTARAGIYGDNITEHVSPERLRRFFVKAEKGYQVAKRVRDLCIFARQNLCHDPPFSRMDVISCRNVLIYFGPELQRQLIPTFHYSLRPEGYLVLGTAESIREFSDLFTLVDRRHKIYSRVNTVAPRTFMEIVPRHLIPEVPLSPQPPTTESWSDVQMQRAADRVMLARYAPPALVINERLEILQSRGRTSPFVELQTGAARLELTRMIREEIAPQVTQAVRKAISEDLPLQVEGLVVSDGNMRREATLEVLPIPMGGQRAKCYLLVFTPVQTQGNGPIMIAEPEVKVPLEEKDQLIAQMRTDLTSTRLYLQSLLEERDGKNQELISANEEIQSANEELQSTNEELETTKEELQSSNEELHTVNDELQNRNTVLTQASNDLLNLLNSVDLPVLMLNNGLTIRHFTPPAQAAMDLRPSDIGRHFSELRLNLNVEDLQPMLQEVLNTLAPQELEVQDRKGHWYLLRVRPYRTADNKIEGLIIALVDIHQLRTIQQELLATRDFSRAVIQTIALPLTVVDPELKIVEANRAFSTLTGLDQDALRGRYLPTLTGAIWSLEPLLRNELERLANSPKDWDRFEFEHEGSGAYGRTYLIHGSVMLPRNPRYMLVTIEDTTLSRDAERQRREERDRLISEMEKTESALGRSQQELRALAASLFTSQEEERRRIARELHDDISQRLAALEIDADAAEKRSQGELAELLERIRGSISDLSEDVRTMSHRLHPSLLEDLGLEPALRSLTEEIGRREGMIVSFVAEDVPKTIPLTVATALYRITQEAIRNVSKHAGPTHTKVLLAGKENQLQLQIADFGEGFDLEKHSRGLGLLSMTERARQIRADFQVWSKPREGTRVTITVPLDEAH